MEHIHKLSFMFVRCSGDLIVHLLQGRRGRVSGSEVISCSHLFQYLCWNRLCVESVLSRGYVVSCCFKNDGTQDLFSFLAVGRKPSFAQRVFYLSTVLVPVGLFQLDTGMMLYRVDIDVHLKNNEDW